MKYLIGNHKMNLSKTELIKYFKDLKKVVKEQVIDHHDHNNLNKLYGNPTAEIMVIEIFNDIASHLPKDVKLESVKLWETATSFAEYRGE